MAASDSFLGSTRPPLADLPSFSRYNSALVQMVLVSFVCFCCKYTFPRTFLLLISPKLTSSSSLVQIRSGVGRFSADFPSSHPSL